MKPLIYHDGRELTVANFYEGHTGDTLQQLAARLRRERVLQVEFEPGDATNYSAILVLDGPRLVVVESMRGYWEARSTSILDWHDDVSPYELMMANDWTKEVYAFLLNHLVLELQLNA